MSPTKEAKITNYDFPTWFAVLAPRGTPHDTVAPLAAAIRDIVASRAVVEELRSMSLEPRFLDGNDLRDLIARETGLWNERTKAMNLNLNLGNKP